MPILALINGSPGTGKTTLAQSWVADHPLSIALDIDTIRSMVGGWRDDEVGARTLARTLSIAMVRAALAEGRDVLVPQLVARREFIDALREVADTHQASFLHVVLTAPVELCVQRCAARDNTTQFVDPGVNLHDVVARWAAAIRAVNDNAVEITTDGNHHNALNNLSAAIEAARKHPQ